MDRRKFVLGSATSALVLGSPALRAAPDRADVTVIGAGLAGMHAAMLLAENGASVVVLEATARPGGRVFTADSLAGRPELGGNQIGPSYARVRDVARQLGVKLGPGANVNAPYSFIVDGKLLTKAQWPDSPLNRTVGAERSVPPNALSGMYIERRTPFSTLDDWLSPEADRYDVSVYEWLKSQGASDAAIQLIDEGLIDPGVHGVSALTVLQEATRSAVELRSTATEANAGLDVYQRWSMASSHVVGGSSRLPEAMAGKLGDRLRFDKIVGSVEQQGTGCEVTCTDGSRYHSDFVVSAVPFSVLRNIRFRPLLAGVQGEAVAVMPYGRQSQVWLEIKRPYWEEDGIDASMWGNGPLTLIRQQIDPDGSRIKLVALAIGGKASALDRLPPAERGRFVLDYLARVRPSTRGRLELSGVFSWEEAPFVHGCRHSYTPGQARRFRHDMIKPHGRIHFAGEHTRRLEVGMESAMESGERVALEILEKVQA